MTDHVASRPRHADSRSTVTRLLCAGAEVDEAFAAAVIRELIEARGLVGGEQRFVAPSYGYDVLPVLGHALNARARRRLRRALTVGGVLVPVLMFSAGGASYGLVGLALCIWLIWATVFVDRLVVLNTLTNRLREPVFDGGVPDHPILVRDTLQRLDLEQNNTSPLVFYGGFRPFVGAGERVRTSAFPILLNGAQPQIRLDGQTVSTKPIKAFTSAEMMTHVEHRLRQVLTTDSQVGPGVNGLEIAQRHYRRAVARQRPEPAAEIQAAQDGYDAAREYLCIRIGSWDQELVTSWFVSFDVRGSTLYTEMHAYELHPVKSGYHEVDRLPSRITTDDLLALAVRSAGGMAAEVMKAAGAMVMLPFILPGLIMTHRKDRPSSVSDAALEMPHNRHEVSDFGARFSVRELAAIPGHHHFFQSVDATKYTDIVERRLLEVIIDFLENRDVDTSEYRARQSAILNYGILQTGDGKIVNTGAMAVGQQATVS